jgi:predicted RNA-binding protein with PUA-like domain
MAKWLMKTEPSTYSYDDLVKDGGTHWNGVRNYAARLHLSAMKVGDQCLIYHSMGPKEIVGIAEVTRTAYPDPCEGEDEPADRWVMVDIKPVRALKKPVTLATVKAHALLSKMELVRQSRLSVCPVKPDEWKTVLALGNG